MDCIVQVGGQTYCAECKAEALRDLRAGVPVQHQLELARIGQRFMAIFLDGLIVGVPMMIVIIGGFALLFVGLGMSEGKPPEEAFAGAILGLQLVLTLLVAGVWIVYEGEMLARSGQTFGKKIMKIKVVTPEGNDITRGQAYGRAAMRQLISLFCALVDYVTAFGQDRTCIHDMAAKTRVVEWNG